MTRDVQQTLADEDNFIFTGELAARHDLANGAADGSGSDSGSVPIDAALPLPRTSLNVESDTSTGSTAHSNSHTSDQFVFAQDSGPQVSDTLVRTNISGPASAVDPISSIVDGVNTSMAAITSTPLFHPVGAVDSENGMILSGMPFAQSDMAGTVTEPHLGAAASSFHSSHISEAAGTTGLVINLTFDSAAMAAPASFRTGVEQAVSLLEAAINDNITLNIDVGYGEINGQTLPNQDTSEGSAQTGIVSYPTLLTALGDVATSTNAKNAVASLPNTATLQGQSTFYISTAQEKVFGMLSPTDSAVDGWVGFGTDFTGNVLIAAALHEITHAMGRIAGESLDLFRYNENHSDNHVFGFAIPATPAYFSINGGTTDLADFGINSDPGDFLDSPASSLTPNDPFDEVVTGTIATLTSIDDEIMNVLGFNLSPTMPAATPSLLPDLLANTFSITSPTSTSVTLNVDIWNYGGTAAPASNMAFYLSTDSTITTADTLLAAGSLPSIPQSYASVPSATITLPTNLTPGEYYLGALANYDNGISEITKSNDASNVVPIELGSNNADSLTVPAGVMYVFGFGGNDTINMGANLKAGDYIDGGTGTNTVILNGNYTGGNAVTLGATTLENIQDLALTTGNSYSLTLNAATIGSGQTFELDGSTLNTGYALTFNAAAQTTGTLNLYTGNGTATLTLGGGTDNVHAGTGTYTFKAGSGTDTIYFGAGFKAADSITGGSGTSVVELSGNYTSTNAVTFGAATLVNVSKLYLAPDNSYALTTNAATIGSGKTMTVAGSGLLSTDTLTLNAGAQTTGTINVQTGASVATITLGGGTANVTLGSSADAVHCAGTGTYTVTGGSGNETVYFNGGFKAADSITGGTAVNEVELSGNYTGASAVVLGASTLKNIQTLYLAPGNSYSLTLNAATVASGQTMRIAGSGLVSGNMLTLDASALTAGALNILTGASTAKVTFAGNFTASDSITGAGGSAEVVLNGNYTGAHALTLGAATLKDVQDLMLTTGNSYSLTLNAATVTSGQTMEIDGSGLVAGNSLTLNTSAVTAGTLNIYVGNSSTDTITLGGGAEDIFFKAGFSASDVITGGGGTNEIFLNGNYTGANAVTMGASTLTNIQQIYLNPGNSYTLTTNAANDPSGHSMVINGSHLVAGNTLTFNGSACAGSFVVNCGAGTNIITGGTGADTLNAGSGTDTFIYTSTTDATSGTNYDTVNGLNFGTAHIQLGFSVGAINTAVTTGSLSTATFQTDLANDLKSLGAHDAVLFTPNAGTLSGQTFLVVDVNGTVGYQAGQDLVIHLSGQTGTLITSDFTT